MEWLKKAWAWIKGLFKRFKFDNELFELGIKKVVSLVRKEIAKTKEEDVREIWTIFISKMVEEFGGIKPLAKLINTAGVCVNKKLGSMVKYVDATASKKVKMIGDEMIKYYNDNF